MSRILIVDDNETNRDMLSRQLKRKGHTISLAVDGAAGVEKAAAEIPDLILMDMSLPVLDGWEATRRVKANPLTKNIPVIALTAHVATSDREKAIQAGCDDYDTKPIDWARLLSKIEGQLRKNKAAHGD
jgi:two-component system, cell cycle response regulator DivK